MRPEECKPGTKVRCFSKSIYPQTWQDILSKWGLYPEGTILQSKTYDGQCVVIVELERSKGYMTYDFLNTDLELVSESVEEKPPKYEVLVKNVKEIAAKINPLNNCQLTHLGRFTNIQFAGLTHKGFTENLLDYIENYPDAKTWALENKVIEKISPKHHIGQIYLCSERNTYWQLSHVGDGKVAMICLETGNLWTSPTEVKHLNDISKDEFDTIIIGKGTELKLYPVLVQGTISFNPINS